MESYSIHSFTHVWFFCLNILFVIFSHTVFVVNSSFLLYSIPLCEYSTDLFLHSTVDEHLSTFQFGSIANGAAVIIPVYAFW